MDQERSAALSAELSLVTFLVTLAVQSGATTPRRDSPCAACRPRNGCASAHRRGPDSIFGPIDSVAHSQEDDSGSHSFEVRPPGSDLAPLTFTHADPFVARLAELCDELPTGSRWVMLRSTSAAEPSRQVCPVLGAAVGALHGASALPARWPNGLLGRTEFDDDGRVFELIDRAMNAVVPGAAA